MVRWTHSGYRVRLATLGGFFSISICISISMLSLIISVIINTSINLKIIRASGSIIPCG
jgi:hypothetical protein